MNKEHPYYKYLFLFGKGDKKIVLHGKEISNYWNDIYDLFDLEGKMIVQKLNGTDFTEEEIRQLFWDLYEDMSDDQAVIKLWVPSLSKLEFWNYGDINDIPQVQDILNKLSEEELEKMSTFFDEIRKSICKMNLEQAFIERQDRELKKMIKGFKVLKRWNLEKKENFSLKQKLLYFKKAKEDSENWALNLRHIIDGIKRKGDLQKVYELLCNSSILGSTHEGKGINLKKELRDYTKEEKKFCERTIKLWLQSEINNLEAYK